MVAEKLPNCYATALGGCAGRRSAEHPISRALLLRLGAMEVEAPWLPGGRRSMTESTLKTRVLCEKHNGMLSPYDAEVCKLFDLIAASSRKELKGWHTLNGGHIERWALKLMFADVAAGKYHAPDGERRAEHPPIEWLRVLFEGAPMPARCGFHYCAKPCKEIDAAVAVGSFYNITPPHDRFPNTLHGVTVVLLGFWFVTSMAPLDVEGWSVDYRPTEFGSWDTSAGFRLAW